MEMLEKSSAYLDASQRIIATRENLHCSVALSYYAVFFFMQFLLAHTKYYPKSYDALNRGGEDNHFEIIKEVSNWIDNKEKKDSMKDRLLTIHQERVNADYKSNIYTIDNAVAIYDEAKSIIATLKYLFTNLLQDDVKNLKYPV